MELNCLHCGYKFDGTISKDELGWHSSCPKCECSFDVDVPTGRIIMAFAQDETYDCSADEYFFTDEYFTDDWCDDNEFLTYYAFNTPKEFMEAWNKMHDYKNGGCPDSMWYWVLDDGELICSGACDPNDKDIFMEHWEL